MITLAQSRQVDGFTVFRDSVFSTGIRSFSATFYCLPDAPRLARDQDGQPLFQFLWYRAAVGAPGSGGLVSVTTELGIESSAHERLTAAIASAYELPGSIELRHVPFRAGRVELAFAGEQDAGESVKRISGSGQARFLPGERASFLVELTADGAALLWEALERKLATFLVRYELEFDVRLDDVELRVWCRAQQSHTAARDLAASGGLTPGALQRHLVDQRLAGVDLKTETALAPEALAALEQIGHNVLKSALASAFFQTGEKSLKPWSPSLEASLNLTFQQSSSLPQLFTASDVLNPGTPAELGQRVRMIDLAPANPRRELAIFCTVDYERDPIDKVQISVSSADAKKDFVFEKGVDAQVFRSIGAARYRYSLDVFYRGQSEPLKLDARDHEGNSLVLDLDGLGVLRIRAALRNVPLKVVKSAIVELEHVGTGLKHRAILDGETPSTEWTVIARQHPAAYRFKVDWLLVDGRRFDGDCRTETTSQLFLDVPSAVLETSEVLLICAESFGDIAQIILDVRTTDGAHTAQFAFTKEDDQFRWSPPVAIDRFEYRRTVVDKNGVFVPLDASWIGVETRVLAVAAGAKHRVEINPSLLDLGGTLKLALIDLEHPGEGAFRASKTFPIARKDGRVSWTYRSPDGSGGRYRYRLNLVRKDGARVLASDWQETDKSVLVLTPLQS